MTTSSLASKALLANLLQKIQQKKPLTASEFKQLQALQDEGGPAAAAPETWPSLNAASAELGLSVAKLRRAASQGCPLEKSEAGIPKAPALLWLWNNREQGNAAESDALKAERLRLGNERMAAQHLAQATTTALRVLQAAADSLRAKLTTKRLAELRNFQVHDTS
jgi:hypothetical protein